MDDHPGQPVKMLFGKPVSDQGQATSSRKLRGGGQPARSTGRGRPSKANTKSFLSRVLQKEQLKEDVEDEGAASTSSPTSPTSSSSLATTTSILAKGIPDAVNSKEGLKLHFAQFGLIRRIYRIPSQHSAIITYVKRSDAEVAKETGSRLRDGTELSIYWKQPTANQLKQAQKQIKAKQEQLAPAVAKAEAATQFQQQQQQADVEEVRRNTPTPELLGSSSLPWVPADVKLPPSVVAMFNVRGQTAQERADVLEKADKIIYDLMAASSAPKREHAIVGTCQDMCPERERYDREFQRRIGQFERLPGNVPGEHTIDHTRALKEYARSAADQREPLPYELRTAETLDTTMTYLLREICPLSQNFDEEAEEVWADWYHFLWTRTRAIRKDITQQHLVSGLGVSLMERCSRFHAFCGYQLVHVPATAGFDLRLNGQNLSKCLQSLKEMYADLRQRLGLQADDELPALSNGTNNEAEFTAYRVLTKLDEGAILTEIERMPPAIRFSERVQFALSVFSAYNRNNYARFFSLFRNKATFVEACLMHRYLTLVRSRALKTIAHAYTQNERFSMPMATVDLSAMLCFENEGECLEFATAHGLLASDSGDTVELSRLSYYVPETWPRSWRLPGIMAEKQASRSISDVINGAPMSDNFELPKPSSSFEAGSGRFVGTTAYRNLLLELLRNQSLGRSGDQQIVKQQQQQQQPEESNTASRAFDVFEAPKANWPSALEIARKQRTIEASRAETANEIAESLIGQVIPDSTREIAFNAVLIMRKALSNADAMLDEVLKSGLTREIRDVAQTSVKEVISLKKGDIIARNVITAETTQTVMGSVIREMALEVAADVAALLVDEASSQLSQAVDSIIGEEIDMHSKYWCGISQSQRRLRCKRRQRTLSSCLQTWRLKTKQVHQFREHSRRPFPTAPVHSLEQAAKLLSYSAKITGDGRVVDVPLAKARPRQLSLGAAVHSATLAGELQLPAQAVKVASLDRLVCQVSSLVYTCVATLKVAVVLPNRYQDNLYALRVVQSIEKTLSTPSKSRLVTSVVVVSPDCTNAGVELEGANCALLLDEVVEAYERSSHLTRLLSHLPKSVFSFSKASCLQSDKRLYHISESLSDCLEHLLSSCQNVTCAVSTVGFLSDFINSKVIAPIRADLHNRKVTHFNEEMPPKLTLSLYKAVLDHLKKVVVDLDERRIAPEIDVQLRDSRPLLDLSEVALLLERDLPLEKVTDDLLPKDFVQRSFCNYPLEVAMISSSCGDSWTSAIVHCISSRLALAFSGGTLDASSVMWINKPPREVLADFTPPCDWLYAAERCQIVFYANRASFSTKRSGNVQIKREISSTWEQIEQFESQRKAKRGRESNSDSVSLSDESPLAATCASFVVD